MIEKNREKAQAMYFSKLYHMNLTYNDWFRSDFICQDLAEQYSAIYIHEIIDSNEYFEFINMLYTPNHLCLPAAPVCECTHVFYIHKGLMSDTHSFSKVT